MRHGQSVLQGLWGQFILIMVNRACKLDAALDLVGPEDGFVVRIRQLIRGVVDCDGNFYQRRP